MSLSKADPMTAEVIAQYLRDHPDFFRERQELTELMSLPVRQEGTVSLVEIKLRRQREKIADLEEEITELMSMAANNGQHFHQFMSLQETILKCHTLSQVVDAINQFSKELSLTAYLKLLHCDNLKHHINMENWQRFATNHFNGKSAYLGRLKKADRDLLFNHDRCPELGSFAILPLEKSKPLGVIAFSSNDGGHFQPSMDTLFLRHLATVVSHLVSTLEWENNGPTNNVLNHTSA
ncbi:DUF484 family protein [Vibrio sp. VB16]|uniref:DUF484 family protein n=1 Tax=Vibrio sp. VB16 TaxID=2785746 RepID=UPI0018A00DAC|nr:DUF484 family protein [Vibrio sp. VB16]UGA54740.1 DUF484 family protein [Vibrio sp. VB16]